MDIGDAASLQHAARLAGFEWSVAEVETLRGALGRAFEMLNRLEQLPLSAVEPVTQYRMM